jgi:hypothetical protein
MKITVPIDIAVHIFPNVYDIVDMPRKKKKKMKKEFNKVFHQRFNEWLKNENYHEGK